MICMNQRDTENSRKMALPPLPLAFGVGVLALLLSAVLTAQPDKQPPADNPQSTSLGSDCPPNAAQVFLPALPRPDIEHPPISGVSDSAPPSNLTTNPDEFKALLGYYGTFYNTERLDGRVIVLANTVSVGSHEFWRSTGMIRNQSCQTVRIGAVTARLLGARGDLLDVVTATIPVDELRPGEPAPFAIETSVPRADVNAVDWHVDYEPSANTPSRSLKLEIYEANPVLGGTRYSLFGSIRNEGTSTALSAHVVAAWLDDQGRVLYLASPKIRLIDDPTQLKSGVDLIAGHTEDFLYTTNDPSLVSLLGEASVALWGVSE